MEPEVDDNALERIEKRLENLERLTVMLLSRVSEPEKGASYSATQQQVEAKPPPPIVTTKKPEDEKWVERSRLTAPPFQVSDVSAPEVPKSTPKKEIDTEYWLGARVMPWVAAFIVFLALAYFAGNAIQQGYITPVVQFWSALAASATFVILGIRLLESRESYGQIVVGLGSASTYLTLAGGHFTWKLFGGHELIAFYLSLTFINIGFSLWRSSKPFLGIGLLGGLVTILMASTEGGWMTLALFFLVMVPSLGITWARKWLELNVLSWSLGFLVLVPLLSITKVVSKDQGVVALYVYGLLGALFYSATFHKNSFDKSALFTGLIALGTNIAGVVLQREWMGAAYVITFAIVLGLMGWQMKALENTAQKALQTTALVTPGIIMPFCWPAEIASISLISLAFLVAIVSSFSPRTSLILFSVVELFLGLCAYVGTVPADQSFFVKSQPEPIDLAIAFGLTLTPLILAYASQRAPEIAKTNLELQNMIWSAAIIFGFIFVSYLGATVFNYWGYHNSTSVTFAWLIYGALLLPLGFVLKLQSVRLWGLGALGLAASKAILVDLSETELTVRILLLMLMGLAMFGLSYWLYIRPKNKLQPVETDTD